jgi:ABC-2 type transport system permease protein
VIGDIWTVMWKEWKEMLFRPGSLRSTISGMLIPIAIVGIFLPWQAGLTWIDSAASLIAWAWVPIFFVTGMVADSFAGERERHTLETLLASRLSDRAILLGKLGASVGYGLGMGAFLSLVGLITVNVIHGQGEILLYSSLTILSGVTAGLIAASLTALMGIHVSLRAATVRQAQQTLGFILMAVFVLPFIVVRFVPETWLRGVAGGASAVGTMWVGAGVALVVLFLLTFLLVAAMVRFRRSRLILD